MLIMMDGLKLKDNEAGESSTSSYPSGMHTILQYARVAEFQIDKCRVKSKETVGNSWTVLKVILGQKYHHNH